MVKGSYRTTNKRFRDSFQKFAGTKTKKGHLNVSGDIITGTGVIIEVEVAKAIAPNRGWKVNLNGQTYKCYNADFDGEYPDYTATASGKYYKFKDTVRAEVSINKKEDIYRIDKMDYTKKNDIKSTNKDIIISSKDSVNIDNQNNNTSLTVGEKLTLTNSNTFIQIEKDNVNISGDLIVNEDNLSKGYKTNTNILNSESIIPGSDSDNTDGITLQNLVEGYKQIKIELESLKKEE